MTIFKDGDRVRLIHFNDYPEYREIWNVSGRISRLSENAHYKWNFIADKPNRYFHNGGSSDPELRERVFHCKDRDIELLEWNDGLDNWV